MIGNAARFDRFDFAFPSSSFFEVDTAFERKGKPELKDAMFSENVAGLAERITIDQQRAIGILVVLDRDQFVALLRGQGLRRRTRP